ncbi:phytoene/squalene synthase family protein [Microbacterium saperdae]|uniref:Phytoene/squalene synthetase n=1 Tax=Microbacterium saperdae TaxID=69368 RepID=A0A543BK07_9MICO|nr:squalene/phytoene synthase family protein [Microbacterium saperdae]TQL85167.1 phytoene/squalene synthetase [Microbacterium saperdae]GGM56404.1 phytoene synthase [Microbacterium saperdae]
MTGSPASPAGDGALDRFSRTAEIATTDVIRNYSTSFGLATRLLGPRHRQHVRNIYAMVRIADEIVDGVAAEAGLDAAAQSDALTSYVAETHRSMRTGYSSDLILHAFARTARECGIGEDLTQPFFDSMRADIASDAGFTAYDGDAHARYVYGSAEVVGLMCTRVFLRGASRTPAEEQIIERGARQLGAAFQNVNFLRDLADDTDRLHRGYLGGGERLTEADRDAWVATVVQQLDDARIAIPLLPKDSRAAVRSAHALFAALTRRVAKTPVDVLYRKRVRVPDPLKAVLAARAVLVTALERDR